MLDMTRKLNDLNIKLEFVDMESKGCYINGLRTIFINQSLSYEETRHVIYHELKHALEHADYDVLYKKPIIHLKMESEANDFMIKQIIYENGGVYNYTQLVEVFKIGMGNDVKYGNP